MKVSDDKLVERLQGGDIEAFDEIFKRYGSILYGFALKYLKSKEDAEGLVQDVFLKIWKNRKNLKKETSLKSYLFTITYHNMCRIFKKRKSHLKFIGNSEHIHKQNTSQEEQIEFSSILEQIDTLVEKLPEKQRIIFLKSRREGKSTREIAEEMELAQGTVDNYISAAIRFLRKAMVAENF